MPQLPPTESAAELDLFLDKHWARPIASQGTLPPMMAKQGISLSITSCSTCHVSQYEDWRHSQHAHAMGPGIMGQLAEMAPKAFQKHQACIRCHAPLKEQAESLSVGLGRIVKPNLMLKQPLHEQGVMCAVCHVREYRWYGPPRRDGSSLSESIAAQFPHSGWESSRAFESSKFCAACHQFTKDELTLNGKPLENTYEEWKASRFASEGKACQSCHMPERRHLFRGIHDSEMVKRGIEIKETEPVVRAGLVSAALTVVNTGTGHFFPTYVTPRVIMEIYQENSAGKPVKGTLKQHVITREVSVDLESEASDTRLAPGERAQLSYSASMSPHAVAIISRIRVEPDDFYSRFYDATLKGNLTHKGRPLVREALKNSRASAFIVHLARHPLR